MKREKVLYIKPNSDHNCVTIPALLIFEVDEDKANQYLQTIDEPLITNDTLQYCDHDRLDAYLRTCAALLCDTFAPNDLIHLDQVIKIFQEGYTNFSIDGTQGIKLIRFQKQKTPPAFFYCVTDLLLNQYYKIHHPDVSLLFSVATYLPERLTEIEKKCARVFYWNSLINHVQGNSLIASLIIISKEICSNFSSMNVRHIIEEMKFNTSLSLDLSGKSGIELITFLPKKHFSPTTSPSVFAMTCLYVNEADKEQSA